MDQNALSGLDPKLRETYERVMGMASPTSASNGTPPPAPPAPSPQDVIPAPIPSSPPSNPQPEIPNPSIPNPPTNNSTPVPIPPPVQTSPQMNSAMYVSPATQQAELTALQPTMTGTAMPKPVANTRPNELVQSLPSPATVNHPASSGLSPALRILYFVAGIIFFVVYAIFWLKIFKYPLPFLPF